jgi:hypothetical protein
MQSGSIKKGKWADHGSDGAKMGNISPHENKAWLGKE